MNPLPPSKRITLPASIVVLTSKNCPNCARVVQQAEELSRQCANVSVEVLDIFDAQDLQAKHEVKSVPATIIDDDLVIQGPITLRRIIEILTSRGTPAYDTIKVRAYLEANRIDAAANFLRQEGRATSILPILATAELTDRMGATLVVQTAQEKAPGSLADLVPGLIELLTSTNVSLRGDVADLLGTLGDPRAVEPLKVLLEDRNEDVVDAASDALESIQGRMN